MLAPLLAAVLLGDPCVVSTATALEVAGVRVPSAVLETVCNPCKLVYAERPRAIDRVRGLVHRTVCASSLWFDNLFGDSRAFEEAERSYGVLSLGGVWEEGGTVDGIGRARIKWRFPAMQQRLSLVLGRVPEERIATDEGDLDGLPENIDEDEQEFVAGLDTAVVQRSSHKLDFGAGVTYGDSLEPYVKVRSRSRWRIGRDHTLNVRLTPYWQDGDREYGIRSTVDFDTQLRPDLLMRWTASGRLDGETIGTRYSAGPVFYHQLNDTYFLAHRATVRGEVRAEIPDEAYGFVSSVRRSIFREWLFVELSAGVDWIREAKAELRESVARCGVVFEMHFGAGR